MLVQYKGAEGHGEARRGSRDTAEGQGDRGLARITSANSVCSFS